jgi:hypothetical protein
METKKMKPNLNTTTLLIVDCLNIDRAIKVVERCKALCDFADIKLLTHFSTDYPHKVEIKEVKTLIHYSVFMLKKIHEYVDTKHILIVQRDGWILNPQAWNKKWEQYDYIGALFNQYDVMGVGGFSFRSKSIMQSVSEKYPQWDGTNEQAHNLQKNIRMYEDGEIAITHRHQLEAEGFKFADLKTASHFGQGGNPNPHYHHSSPFGFHGSWKTINQETGFVYPEIKHDGEILTPI